MKFNRAVFDRQAFNKWFYACPKHPGAEAAAVWSHDHTQHLLEEAHRAAGELSRRVAELQGERDVAVQQMKRARESLQPLQSQIARLESALNASVAMVRALEKKCAG